MATFTATLNFYESFKLDLCKDINLDTDTFKFGLTTSAYTPNSSAHSTLADITNELSGNGYAQQTVANISLTLGGGTVTWDFDDVVFTASGGSLVARYFFVYDDTVAGDPLVGWGLLNDVGVDVTITDGNTGTLIINGTTGFVQVS